VLLEYRGEDTGADVVRGPAGELFTSLGYLATRRDQSGQSTQQGSVLRAPRRLALGAALLVSLNLDLSVTVWRAADLERVADLFVFRDDEWLAASGPAAFRGSPGGLRRLARESGATGASR